MAPRQAVIGGRARIARLLAFLVALVSLSLISFQVIANANTVDAWVKVFSTGSDPGSNTRINTYFNTIAIGPRGNLVLAGAETVETSLSVLSRNMLTIKYSPMGRVQWARKYRAGQYYEAIDSAVSNSGDVFVLGRPFAAGSVLLKYDSMGHLKWAGRMKSRADTLVLDSKNNAYVVCNLGFNTLIAKFNPQGHRLWTRTFDSGFSRGNQDTGAQAGKSAAIDGQDNIYVGLTSAGQDFDYNITVLKYDEKGKRKWLRRFPSRYPALARLITVDNSDNVIVAGIPGAKESTLLALKYDPTGALKWVRRYGSTYKDKQGRQKFASESWSSILVDRDDDVFFIGEGTEPKTHFLAMKLKPQGSIEWIRKTEVSEPRGLLSGPMQGVVDDNGRLFLSDFLDLDGEALSWHDRSIESIGYDSSGTVFWRREQPGGEVNDMALGKIGRVYLGGRLYGDETSKTTETTNPPDKRYRAFVKKYRP